MQIHSFEVDFEEGWDGDATFGNYTTQAVVKLAGVELFRQTVWDTSFPGWKDEAAELAVASWAECLKEKMT